MKLFNFINKYEILKQRLKVGEIIRPTLIKKISSKRAIVSIDGYRVVIEENEINNNFINNKFVILGFNNKEKVILLKKINNNILFNEGYHIPYFKEFLLKNNLPVNSSNLLLAKLLYTRYNSIDINILRNLIQLTHILNTPELIFYLYEITKDYKILENFLQAYKNFLIYFKSINKKIEDSDKSSRLLYISKKNVKSFFKLIFNNNKWSDLLKFNKDFKLYFLHLFILNYSDGINIPFLNYINNHFNYIRIKKEKENYFIKLEFNIDNSKLFVNLFYNMNSLDLKILSEKKELVLKIEEKLKELEEKLKKIIRLDKIEVEYIDKINMRNFDYFETYA